MRKFLALLLIVSPLTHAADAEVNCAARLTAEETMARLTRFFDTDPEPEMRAALARPTDAFVTAYKNNAAGLPGRVIPAARLLPRPVGEKALRDDEELSETPPHFDLTTDLPRTHRALVTSLRSGDVITFSDATSIELGEFVDWGGTTHLFAVKDQPDFILRVPRAVRIKFTRSRYLNREEKTAHYYSSYRDALALGGEPPYGQLPILNSKVKDGLIFVERFRPFWSASDEANAYRSAVTAGEFAPERTLRRNALIAFLRHLRGRSGVSDVHLDSLVWKASTHSWNIADFGVVSRRPPAPDQISAEYVDLVAEAVERFSIGGAEFRENLQPSQAESPGFFRVPTVPMPLRGIVTPLVTPLRPTGELDTASLGRLLDHVLSRGVAAVMVLGTTGEGLALPFHVRDDLIRETCRLAERRAPVLVNVSATSIDETVRLIARAEAHGASAVVLSPPPYFELTESELLSYVKTVTSHARVPLFLYNIPSQVHQSFPPRVVAAAAKLPGVIGIKDSSGDLDYFRELKAALAPFGNFTILVGTESKLRESLVLGAHGGVSGGSNVFPEMFVGLFEANRAGDGVATDAAEKKIQNWKRRSLTIASGPNASIKVSKAALVNLGVLSSASLTPPFEGLRPDEIARLKGELRD